MAMHEPCIGAWSEWYTPPGIFKAMRVEFAFDAASPGRQIVPWIPAEIHITHDSLITPWPPGLCWLNPPFGGRGEIEPWLIKFFKHGNGIALVPDRTSCPWFQRHAGKADLILLVAPKIKFLDPMGRPGKSPSNGTALLAIGDLACQALRRARAAGLGLLMMPVPLEAS